MNFFKSIAVTFSLLFSTIILAQDFEGVVEFKRINHYDTTFYVYYISADKVRIDELNEVKKVTGTMQVDLKTEKVIAINHDRKLYMDVPSKPSVKDLSSSVISKTKEKKNVLGHNCVKWTVDNPDYKSKADYWVVDKPYYSFFNRLLTALNRKDKIALYFMQIPDNMGFFPIIGNEKGYDGKLRARLETDVLTEKKVDKAVFNIPGGYKEFKTQ